MSGRNCLIKAEEISSPTRVLFFFEFQFLIRTECFHMTQKHTLFSRHIGKELEISSLHELFRLKQPKLQHCQAIKVISTGIQAKHLDSHTLY